jgi:hypothetical protein
MKETQNLNEMGIDQVAAELERVAETLEGSAYEWDHEHAAVIKRAVELFRLARWETGEDAANWWAYELSRNLHKAEREAFVEGFQRGKLCNLNPPHQAWADRARTS